MDGDAIGERRGGGKRKKYDEGGDLKQSHREKERENEGEREERKEKEKPWTGKKARSRKRGQEWRVKQCPPRTRRTENEGRETDNRIRIRDQSIAGENWRHRQCMGERLIAVN